MREPADIFKLARNEDALTRLRERDGYGETSIGNLVRAIEGRRTIALARFIFALGVRHVGETTAVTLARGYGSATSFLKAMDDLAAGDASAAEELDAMDQIGAAVVEAARGYFAEAHNRTRVDHLVPELTIEDAEPTAADTAVAGKTVVFTGSLETLTRERGQGPGRAAGRQGRRLGLQEDRHRGGRSGARVQAEDRRGAGRPGDDRAGMADACESRLIHAGLGSALNWVAELAEAQAARSSHCSHQPADESAPLRPRP